MDWVILEVSSVVAGLAAGILYGGYRYRQRDRTAAGQPPRDFEKPPNEGDLL